MKHSSPEVVKEAGAPGVRERSLGAARRLFTEKGYAGASTRDIAQDVGVTVPALYYHFGSKRGILVALVQDHLSGCLVAVEEALVAGGSCSKRLRRALLAYLAFLARESATPAILVHDPDLFADAELRALVRSGEMRVVERLRGLLEEGAAGGEFRAVDSESTAVLLLGATRAVHHARCFWRGEESLVSKPLDQEMVSLLLHGLERA